jgi:hypothetical protein
LTHQIFDNTFNEEVKNQSYVWFCLNYGLQFKNVYPISNVQMFHIYEITHDNEYAEKSICLRKYVDTDEMLNSSY